MTHHTLRFARKLAHGALLTIALSAGLARSAAAQSAVTWPTTDFGHAPAMRDVAPRATQTKSSLPRLGAMLDVGLPDGIMGGLSYRPQPWLRLQAGAGSNAISPGIRGGVVFVPFGAGPSLTLEAGHYFEGNANGLIASLAGSEYRNNAIAERVGYQFANLHAGFELGQERFTFFLHGGISYLHTQLHHVDEVLGATEAGQNAAQTYGIGGDSSIDAWIPSLKLGFIVHLV
ncbi:MAG: hypothetical protein JW940_28300 [Polyangiaceae bacterium]|nr:hypothetical protein [Polyangiaceae bacterium]